MLAIYKVLFAADTVGASSRHSEKLVVELCIHSFDLIPGAERWEQRGSFKIFRILANIFDVTPHNQPNKGRSIVSACKLRKIAFNDFILQHEKISLFVFSLSCVFSILRCMHECELYWVKFAQFLSAHFNCLVKFCKFLFHLDLFTCDGH